MKTDALNRRSRFAGPQPLSSKTVLNERDYALFEALDLHGKLPSNYLFELTKHIRGYKIHFTKRLTQLFNGYCPHPDHTSENPDGHVCKPVCYLARDRRQFLTFHGNYQHSVYELNAAGKRIVDEQNELKGKRSYPFRRSGAFEHDLFSACLTASFAVQAAPNRFISRNEILSHERCPQETRDAKAPFELPVDKKYMLPDDLFGLEYAGGGFRFFALEADRASMRIDTEVTEASSIAKKVHLYSRILSDRVALTRWGIPNLTILFPTTSAARAANIVAYIRKTVEPRFHPHFLVRSFDGFSKDEWRVPRELLPVFEPWMQSSGEVDISHK